MKCLILPAFLLGLSAAPALAATVGVELNRLEARDGGACRVLFVVRNEEARSLDELRLDLAFFDRAGVIARRVVVDLGPVPASKTQVKSFDLAGLACDGVGSVLMNDVAGCRSAGEARSDCLGALRLNSRAGVDFLQ